MEATEKFLKSGFITVDIFAVSPVDEKTERDADGAPGAATAPQRDDAASPSARRPSRPGTVVIRDVGQVAAPIDKRRRRGQARAPPCGSTWWCAPARSATSSRAAPWTRSTSGWSCRGTDADGKRGLLERPGGGRRQGPGRAGRALLPSYQLDGEGNPINKRNAWQARSVLYVRLIPPGAADVAHYRVKIPEDAAGPDHAHGEAELPQVRALLHAVRLCRPAEAGSGSRRLIGQASQRPEYSFDPANIPANVSGKIKDEIPDLPIVTLARPKATLPLGDAGRARSGSRWCDKTDRERWNDWGIGLLLQGDLKGGGYAFKKVTEAEPGTPTAG